MLSPTCERGVFSSAVLWPAARPCSVRRGRAGHALRPQASSSQRVLPPPSRSTTASRFVRKLHGLSKQRDFNPLGVCLSNVVMQQEGVLGGHKELQICALKPQRFIFALTTCPSMGWQVSAPCHPRLGTQHLEGHRGREDGDTLAFNAFLWKQHDRLLTFHPC